MEETPFSFILSEKLSFLTLLLASLQRDEISVNSEGKHRVLLILYKLNILSVNISNPPKSDTLGHQFVKSGKFQTRPHEMNHNPNRQTKTIVPNYLRLCIHEKQMNFVFGNIPKYKNISPKHV